ncbi:hypothetical protein BDQ17DRAFT_1455107 [Cyathus striatus]|nr:hypothetical protein BDQ17DRAFT_1455107 [Cyathus striatus]
MPVTPAQKSAVEEVISALLAAHAPRGKRLLCSMFMDLVDRKEWPEYYEIIPEPRCLNNIRDGVEKGRYREASDVYTDLSLVFWNAIFYNETGSQIVNDAESLKKVLEAEWKKRAVLPTVRASPPPSSPQKVHVVLVENAKRAGPPSSSIKVATGPTTAFTPAATSLAAPTPILPSAPAATSTRPSATPAIPSAAITRVNSTQPSFSYSKPVPIQLSTTQRMPTPDMDVDIMSTDAEGGGDDGPSIGTERDPESEAIVKQLEKGLPRWSGFGDRGWMEEATPDRLIEIVHAIKSHKDVIGNRLSVALESLSEETTIPHLGFTTPLSLKLIDNKVRSKNYTSAKEFDVDMARLFLKGRRWYDPATESYGHVLLLQRLYQSLTSEHPLPGPPYLSSTNFASLRAGPGTAKPVHGPDAEGVPGVTSHRVSTKDRTFVDEVHYKGWSVKLADWLHLSNPDDPSRPIIGQVFRCWVSDEPMKKGQAGVTVSWYFRPEQTFHPSNRKFWEGEVFKTSHFADHPLEDIIEKIACQFTARHIRGRPRPPYWYPGFPLYVCDSRYNDRDRVFVRIKNWNSCVPEEVRKSEEFMPIYPFETTVFPIRLPSPFLTKGPKSNAKLPGGVVQVSEQQPSVDPDDPYGTKKRVRRTGDAGPNKGLYLGGTAQSTSTLPAGGYNTYQPTNPSYQPNPQRSRPDRSIVTAASGSAVVSSNIEVEKLPPETTKHFDRDPETNELLWFAAPPLNMARAPKAKHSLEYLHFVATKRKRQGTGGHDDEEMDLDDVGNPAKRPHTTVPPTVTEMMRKVFLDMSAGT